MSVETIDAHIQFSPDKGVVQFRFPNTPFSQRAMPERGQWWHGRLVTVSFGDVSDGEILAFHPRMGMFISPNDGTGMSVEMDKNQTFSQDGPPVAVAFRERLAEDEAVTIFTKISGGNILARTFVRNSGDWTNYGAGVYDPEDFSLLWPAHAGEAVQELQEIPTL